jgi:hypothetical protein
LNKMSHLCTSWPEPQSLYYTTRVAGMTGLDHHSQFFLVEMGAGVLGASLNFCLRWPWTTILRISASQVARITGVSHHTQPKKTF